MCRAKWRRRGHGQRALERKVRRGDKVRGQWSAVNDNVGSRLLTQKRAEQRGTWKVATNRAVLWKRRRRTLQVITRTFPCGKWLHKIKKRPTSECKQCKKAWMAAGKTGTVPDKTVDHIQGVQCASQEEVVMAAHNQCWREIMGGITKHGSAKWSIISRSWSVTRNKL